MAKKDTIFILGVGYPTHTYLAINCRCPPIPYPGGVASRVATIIYVAMVIPILYDTPSHSNLKYASYWLHTSNFGT